MILAFCFLSQRIVGTAAKSLSSSKISAFPSLIFIGTLKSSRIITVFPDQFFIPLTVFNVFIILLYHKFPRPQNQLKSDFTCFYIFSQPGLAEIGEFFRIVGNEKLRLL